MIKILMRIKRYILSVLLIINFAPKTDHLQVKKKMMTFPFNFAKALQDLWILSVFQPRAL